jgi:hypothetical protein
MHGGANGSGAPKGERNGMWKHGSYASEAIALRRVASQLMQIVREWGGSIPEGSGATGDATTGI